MSGHSHSANIKRKKQAMDAKRGKLFSQISRLITLAVKEKGAHPESNPELKRAIEKAKEANMPKENIARAIKRGQGQEGQGNLEQVLYEAYGPGGLAMIIKLMTDNKNRSLAEIKHILNQHEGKLAEAGSVKYLFQPVNDGWQAKYPMEINEPQAKNQASKLLAALEENNEIEQVYTNLK